MRNRPSPFMRWLFRIPPVIHGALYRFGRAESMRGRMLLLTTRGRRSGRPRTCGLNYAIADGTAYVMSSFKRSDWLRNLEADPHVLVSLGQECWAGHARVVCDLEERRRGVDALRKQSLTQGPPDALRPLLKRLGFDYDAEFRKLDDPSLDLPLVAIRRCDQAAGMHTPAGPRREGAMR